MRTLPDSYADLLERPLFANLATVRPDGSPQSKVALSVADPDDPYRYLEIRGRVEKIKDGSRVRE